MRLNPYLHFDGNCAAAFAFYAGVLGGKILMKMTYGEAPLEAQVPPGCEGRVMHMRMELGGSVLMGSDAPPGRAQAMQGCTDSLNVDEPGEAERVYAGLSAGGEVVMAMGETFWARRFGMFTDRFGVAWMVNCERVG